jgi:hypothetical protein
MNSFARRCVSVIFTVGFLGCGSSSTGNAPSDAGSKPDSTSPADASHPSDSSMGPDGAGATTTIAAARKGNVTTKITVNAFVTALAGVPKDYPDWYIEDPAGGPYSGVDVYCDPADSCTVPEPALHDLIQVTGALTTYMGQIELIPTSMKVLESNATFPPVATLTATDVAPSGDSPYRGVFVKLAIPSKLVADDVTPVALFDTECGTPVGGDAGAAEAGAEAGADAGHEGGTGGLPMCSPLCEPPAYSGFRANDGTGDEVYITAPFFNTDPLQSSPECLTQKGVVDVTVGTTFNLMQGVLDIRPYTNSQTISPVLPTDYGIDK